MPTGRGTKHVKSTQRRKGQAQKPLVEITEYSDTSRKPQELESTNAQQPFHLTFCAGLIKRCYGCKQEFTAKQRRPPNDLLLKRFDFRIYLSPKTKTQRKTNNLQSTYFHLSAECARRVQPQFEYKDIVIHNETRDQLIPGHQNILDRLGINI